MAEVDLVLRFEGPALDDGAMDVRDLAPALLAFGQMFTTAHQLLHPDDPRVSLDIKATSEGSFVVHLQVAQRWYDALINLLTNEDATALATFVALVGAGITIVKKSVGRVRRVDLDDGTVRLTFPDGTTLEVPAEVFVLLADLEFRTAARNAVQPLARDGVDRLELEAPSIDDQPLVIVEKADLPRFEVPAAIEPAPIEGTTDMAVTVASVSFVDGNKWRFNDGENTFFAAISDERFLNLVHQGTERFGKGDVLRVRMKTTQQPTATGLKIERHVLEVLDHTSAARNVPLPFYDD